jgi:hypothetical protein
MTAKTVMPLIMPNIYILFHLSLRTCGSVLSPVIKIRVVAAPVYLVGRLAYFDIGRGVAGHIPMLFVLSPPCGNRLAVHSENGVQIAVLYAVLFAVSDSGQLLVDN